MLCSMATSPCKWGPTNLCSFCNSIPIHPKPAHVLNRIKSDTDTELDMLVSKHDGSEAVVFS